MSIVASNIATLVLGFVLTIHIQTKHGSETAEAHRHSAPVYVSKAAAARGGLQTVSEVHRVIAHPILVGQAHSEV